MGRDSEQGLGQLPDALPVKVLQILRGHDEVGFLLADPLESVADILDDGGTHRHIIRQPHIQLVQRRCGVADGQQAVGHIGQDVEQHGAAHILAGLQQPLDPEDDEAGGCHIGVPIEELGLCTLTHGVEPQQDLLQQFRRVQLMLALIVLSVLLINEFIEVGKDGIVLGLEAGEVGAVADAPFGVQLAHHDLNGVDVAV